MGFKQVIVVRSDLGMAKGKVASQVAHASLSAFELAKKHKPSWVNSWLNEGQTKVVLKVSSLDELLDIYNKAKKSLPCVLVRDAGKTQVSSGAETCVGIGPAPDFEVDMFTRGLKLL